MLAVRSFDVAVCHLRSGGRCGVSTREKTINLAKVIVCPNNCECIIADVKYLRIANGTHHDGAP